MKDNNSIALLTSWNLSGNDDRYYIPYTHYVYLEYITKFYEKVYLISSVKSSDGEHLHLTPLESLSNLEVVGLPSVSSHLRALLNFRQYFRAIKKMKREVPLIYCRVPDPFCWMPRLVFDMPTIMHYVGNTIDVIKNNKGWSTLKKILMIAGYLPEYFLTLLATKQSRAFCNGTAASEKLQKYKINITPLISSTIKQAELYPLRYKDIKSKKVYQFVFTGYLRKAKGINVLFDLIEIFEKKMATYKFHILGDGELYEEFQQFVKIRRLEDRVILYGHINDRNKMNAIYRESDLFIFPSLSEGSPRSVLEAMAQGLVVVSTPVGSLPTTFTEDEIQFANYDDALDFYSKINRIITSDLVYNKLRNNAYAKVKDNYTIDAFLSKIFRQ